MAVDTISGMSSTLSPDGRALAAELNRQIRALFTHRDARLTDEQRAEYHRLLARLREVERGDVVEAA